MEENKIVWAWYCRTDPDGKPDALRPVKGAIADHAFAPDPAERVGRPDLAASYPLDEVTVHDNEREAVIAYNAAIRKIAAKFLRLASSAQDLLVKTEEDGWDDQGYLEDFPVFAVDLSSRAEDVIAQTDRKLTLLENAEGEVIPWHEFLALVDNGDFNYHDGQADLMIDGLVSENVLVDMYRGMIYVADKYLVTFERVADLFRDHEINAVWFSK